MKRLPIVALVGQTNAGKSSLLNRLARRNIAIVAREEGTTRDNVVATIDEKFILIDTAGLKNPEDDFEASIQDQIADAIDSANLILVTLDSSKFPDQKDRDIIRLALKSKKPTLLVLNKSDIKGPDDSEFLFGIKPSETIRTSATTGQGISDLKHKIYETLSQNELFANMYFRDTASRQPAVAGVARLSLGRNLRDVAETHISKSSAEKQVIKLALIGRPNVGKSSLFNALSKKQQAIVSSKQGTTRDVNRVQIKYEGETIEILDTAGLRKPGKREVGIEKFSALRTLAAIEEADVCALLIDSTEPHSKLDQSLAGQITEAGKGIIVVVTKTDLLKDSTPIDTLGNKKPAALKHNTSPTDIILDQLESDFNFLPFAPVLLTSSETGKNVTKLFDLTLKVDAARHTELKTSELNKILREAILSHPPAGLKNTHPKPKYIVQTDTCPPWFVIHGREMELMHWSYKRYLERKIREHYDFLGTPIKFSFKNEK